MGVGRLYLLWYRFTRASVSVCAFDATLFLFFANAWLPGEIKVIELAEMTVEFCLQLNAPNKG